MGGGNTVWRGSAFNCSSKANQIILRHSRFGASAGGTSGSCNNGAIVGQSVGVENGQCFISQLRVSVSETLNSRAVRCDYSAIDETLIGAAVLNVISGEKS